MGILAVAVLAAAAVAATTRADDHVARHQSAKPSMDHMAHHGSAKPSKLAREIARARVALAPFATDLRRARTRGGYKLQITPMMPGMGFHYMNPDVKRFDVRRPPILVYVRRGGASQLVAAEWVFPSKPAKPPLPGARYGSFAAACHYADGTFVPETDEAACAPKAPGSGSKFTFWHPDLVTMHLWLWYPNPDGVFNSTNRLVVPFERAG